MPKQQQNVFDKTGRSYPFGVIKGPVWIDACEHPEGSYICSFEILQCPHHKGYEKGTLHKYDVYMFPAAHGGTGMCFRSGNEGGDYISPGSMADFLSRQCEFHRNNADIYHRVAQVISSYMNLSWLVRPKGEWEQD